MRQINQDELKKIEVDILKYIRNICEENNIQYYLAYGTLIGAVRHKGFIPWDDDIDIMVPIEQYNKLIRIIDEDGGEYKVLDWENNSNYFYPFAKVVDSRTRLVELEEKAIDELGVYVDIFPLIAVPQNRIQYNLFMLKMRRLIREWRYSSMLQPEEKKGILKRLVRDIRFTYANRKGAEYWLNEIRSEEKKRPVSNAEVIGDYYSARSKNFLAEKFELEFEGEMFSAPSTYDDILSGGYGDYMELPPKEQRVTHHHFKAWYVE